MSLSHAKIPLRIRVGDSSEELVVADVMLPVQMTLVDGMLTARMDPAAYRDAIVQALRDTADHIAESSVEMEGMS
ncbi:hypothetical protein [Nonomuraea sp. NPDC050310]|uniref:hypothetical protein n=1 Tax=Nonomuraea sp. NPDC050310 TaxID=3154935 RepID=UPI0033C72C39